MNKVLYSYKPDTGNGCLCHTWLQCCTFATIKGVSTLTVYIIFLLLYYDWLRIYLQKWCTQYNNGRALHDWRHLIFRRPQTLKNTKAINSNNVWQPMHLALKPHTPRHKQRTSVAYKCISQMCVYISILGASYHVLLVAMREDYNVSRGHEVFCKRQNTFIVDVPSACSLALAIHSSGDSNIYSGKEGWILV